MRRLRAVTHFWPAGNIIVRDANTHGRTFVSVKHARARKFAIRICARPLLKINALFSPAAAHFSFRGRMRVVLLFPVSLRLRYMQK